MLERFKNIIKKGISAKYNDEYNFDLFIDTSIVRKALKVGDLLISTEACYAADDDVPFETIRDAVIELTFARKCAKLVWNKLKEEQYKVDKLDNPDYDRNLALKYADPKTPFFTEERVKKYFDEFSKEINKQEIINDVNKSFEFYKNKKLKNRAVSELNAEWSLFSCEVSWIFNHLMTYQNFLIMETANCALV